MDWIKIVIDKQNHTDNIFGWEILVTDGDSVWYIKEHGWHKDEYYFHDGNGIIHGLTHWMPLPKPPVNEAIEVKDA